MSTTWCEKCGGILSSTEAIGVSGCTCIIPTAQSVAPVPDWVAKFPNINEKYSDLLQSHHTLCGEIEQKSAYIRELSDALEETRKQRDAALLKIEEYRRFVTELTNTTEDSIVYWRRRAQFSLDCMEKPKDECRVYGCGDPEHEKKHDFSKWPDPQKCELCRYRIEGHKHVSTKEKRTEVPPKTGLGTKITHCVTQSDGCFGVDDNCSCTCDDCSAIRNF